MTYMMVGKEGGGPMCVRCWPSCRELSDGSRCAECGAQMPSADDGDYPPVTWHEVREHLTRRLFIDDEWRVDHDQGFSWWPWFLRQDVAVAATDRGTGFDRPDALLRVTATTETVKVPDEASGLHLVAEANRTFPYGAFILRDRTVVATSSVALNPLCRGMLTAFHQAMFVQATVAHQIADAYVSEPGVEILASDHPRSGVRAEPDELLGIYVGDECRLPPLDGFAQYLSAARPIYRELLVRGGLEPGFCTDDTDLFNSAGNGHRDQHDRRQAAWTAIRIGPRIADQVPQPRRADAAERGQHAEPGNLKSGRHIPARASTRRQRRNRIRPAHLDLPRPGIPGQRPRIHAWPVGHRDRERRLPCRRCGAAASGQLNLERADRRAMTKLSAGSLLRSTMWEAIRCP